MTKTLLIIETLAPKALVSRVLSMTRKIVKI